MSTVNRGIINNGLVLCLDAANSKSYVSGSTLWNDISKNNNPATLVNTPTFNFNNAGSIVFNGTNNYIANISTPLLVTGSMTYEIVFKPNATPNNGPLGTSDIVSTIPYFYLDYGGGTLRTYHYGSSPQYFNVQALSTNNIYHFVCSRNGLTESNYINGVSTTGRVLTDNSGNTNGLGAIGGYTPSSWYFNCNIYMIRIYSIPLSSTQVLQNYNATKVRFGL